MVKYAVDYNDYSESSDSEGWTEEAYQYRSYSRKHGDSDIHSVEKAFFDLRTEYEEHLGSEYGKLSLYDLCNRRSYDRPLKIPKHLYATIREFANELLNIIKYYIIGGYVKQYTKYCRYEFLVLRSVNFKTIVSNVYTILYT